MKRSRQKFGDIEASLVAIDASWKDKHAEDVIKLLHGLPRKKIYSVEDVANILDRDFLTAMTTVRLFLDISKDDFTQLMQGVLGAGGIGIKRYQKERKIFLAALVPLGAVQAMISTACHRMHWTDVLVERLKGGRGSAIKGQTRGRGMENELTNDLRILRMENGL